MIPQPARAWCRRMDEPSVQLLRGENPYGGDRVEAEVEIEQEGEHLHPLSSDTSGKEATSEIPRRRSERSCRDEERRQAEPANV